MALSRFREAKTAEEEVNLVRNAVPKSTQYKNKWAYGIFEEWQEQLQNTGPFWKPSDLKWLAGSAVVLRV